MRIATTASPVSGSEVRERTVQLADESSRQWAEAHITASVRSHVSNWRIRAAERGRLVRDGLGDGPRLPRQPAVDQPDRYRPSIGLIFVTGKISPGLVQTNSNISELIASKSSEPGGSGAAEAFEASAAPHPTPHPLRRRRSTFG